MKKNLPVSLSIILFILFLQGDLSRSQTANLMQIEFDVDYSRFRSTGEFVYLEIHYAAERNQLRFIHENDSFVAKFKIEISIFQNDSLLVTDVLNSISQADSLSQIQAGQILVEQSAFVVRPDTYNLLVRISDLNSERTGVRAFNLVVEPISSETLTTSDLQLASSVRLNRENPDKFTKNGYQVLPNPAGIYGIEAPMLYYYAEIYNFVQIEETNQYGLKVFILDASGQAVRTIIDKVKEKPGGSSVEVAGFNIITLKSGQYTLLLEVTDLASNQVATEKSNFFVYREADFPTGASPQADPPGNVDATKFPEYGIYDQLEESEIDDEFFACAHVATKEEKDTFKELKLEGKRAFMKAFWVSRDQDTSTPVNEYRRQYLKNIRIVNERFGAGKPGWESDRGRVFLIYGEPDDIERFQATTEGRPYQIWNYFKIQGGVQFMFVDVRGFGEYVLVHSSARNELQDPDWRRWVSIQ